MIAGAAAAGVAAAEELRRCDYTGRITMLSAEPQIPYDRPPLSKQLLLGTQTQEQLALRPHETYEQLGIDLRLGTAAAHLDHERHVVWCENGEQLHYSSLIITTGVRPRRLDLGRSLEGVHVLRTVADAIGLQQELQRAAHVVVIGAGVLGCEVASSARATGIEVTLIGNDEAPMRKQLGSIAASALSTMCRDSGIALRLGQSVRRLLCENGRVTAVESDSGDQIPADAVVAAIGSEPSVEWLRTSGLDISDGVICDAYCRAAEDVYAAGDVASWFNERFGSRMRLEHRLNATEHGIAAARNVLGANLPFTPIPYFWSDQHGRRLQVYGRVTPGSVARIVDGDFGSGRFVVAHSEGGRLVAAIGCGSAKAMLRYRQQISDDWPVLAN